MNLVPVALERWIIAGVLLIPASGLLALLALEGQAGRLTAAVAAIAGIVYAAVNVVVLGRDLARQVAAARPAGEDARLEPLANTAMRALPRAFVAVAVCVVASLFDLLILGVGLVVGGGLVAAGAAAQLQRSERRDRTRLVRPGGSIFKPAEPLQRMPTA